MKAKNASRTNILGFTLVEVMVALVIIGIALPSIVVRVQSIMDNTFVVEEKTYAYWIAENKMQELLVDYRIQKKFKKKKDREEIEYLGQKWIWQINIESRDIQIGDDKLGVLYEFEVQVGREDDNWLATLSGFVAG